MTSQHQIIAVDEEGRGHEVNELDAQFADDDDDTIERSTASKQSAATPRPEFAAPYLPAETSAEASARWQAIQAEFVDDPHESVAEAHKLVGELVQRIVDAFTKERGDLEKQWSQGDSVSTEDLRVCLQRYRAFFSRLLPSVKELNAQTKSA
jgi:hypothetical protein